MKPTKKAPILQGSLSSLIEKFSHQDVIAEMEKEYQSAPTKLLSLSLIDDNAYVDEVLLPEEVVASFSQSLQKKGFYNPVAVRKKEGGRYELILGRKRFFAAKRAGMVSLPAAIVDVGDEETLLMLLADTRDQRENNVVEMALVCQALSKEFRYTQQMLADLSHQSRSQITNTMRILKLPKPVRDDICLGRLSYGKARAIASLPKGQMLEAAETVKREKMSARETELYCASKKKEVNHYGEIARFKKEYGIALEMKSRSLTFRFSSREERNRFLATLERSVFGEK